jgi:mannose-6-phosphate isomerase-like protein (cupin superfamily)
MKKQNLSFDADFAVGIGNERSQAAIMVLAPHDTTGSGDNRHKGADQWLFVVSGHGTAVVDGRKHPLKPHTLLLIERGESHEIRNDGDTPLQTLNLYAPPAYNADGEELPAGES